MPAPDPADTRAEPLPEESAAETGGEDRRAAAEAILSESEERVTEASEAEVPGDAADEHRPSAETSR